MATKAYLMVRVKSQFRQNSQMEDILAQLQAIPEVKSVEQIDGPCDLLVQVEAPILSLIHI